MKPNPRWILAALGLTTTALFAVPHAYAADNQGTGDIAGDAAAIAASNVFTLTSTQLALVKRAFLADGTPLTSGANLPRGTVVKFMIYVNNTTAFVVDDMSVRDALDPAFAYQTGTVRVDSSVPNCASGNCTAAEEAAIYTAVNAQAPVNDVVDADVASVTGGNTIDVGNQNQSNAQLNVPANRAWAVLFTVKIQ